VLKPFAFSEAYWQFATSNVFLNFSFLLQIPCCREDRVGDGVENGFGWFQSKTSASGTTRVTVKCCNSSYEATDANPKVAREKAAYQVKLSRGELLPTNNFFSTGSASSRKRVSRLFLDEETYPSRQSRGDAQLRSHSFVCRWDLGGEIHRCASEVGVQRPRPFRFFLFFFFFVFFRF
jgi:hypothetical protein